MWDRRRQVLAWFRDRPTNGAERVTGSRGYDDPHHLGPCRRSSRCPSCNARRSPSASARGQDSRGAMSGTSRRTCLSLGPLSLCVSLFVSPCVCVCVSLPLPLPPSLCVARLGGNSFGTHAMFVQVARPCTTRKFARRGRSPFRGAWVVAQLGSQGLRIATQIRRLGRTSTTDERDGRQASPTSARV